MAGVELYQQFLVKDDILLRDVFRIIDQPQQLRCYLQREGLLGDFGGECDKCHNGTVSFVCEGEKKGKPQYSWKCGSSKCRARISPRKDSFFEGSHLTDGQIFGLIYSWVYRSPEDNVKRELQIGSDHTLVDWFNFCRDICCQILFQDNKKIGG